MDKGIRWWGYIHKNGSLHVKRFFSSLDLIEAKESPFVDAVYGPWNVMSRDEAIRKLRESSTGDQ